MDIDVVILWVDGNDPEWRKEKALYQEEAVPENATANRYRDWGILRYWFRSIEQFMPWVRKVHFVTWGHLPKFLNCNAPKLNIVRHEDFIPGKYLPTFSSHAIEMNMHRIPDLAEHFIYFNDDMFLLKKKTQEDFFKNGLPCTYGGEAPLSFVGNIGTWQHAMVNDLGIVNAHFPKRKAVQLHGKKYVDKAYRWKDNIRTFVLEKLYPDHFIGFMNIHAPAAYLKSAFQKVWDEEPEKLQKTSEHRFRTSDDVNQWVVLWWQIASGQFTPAVIDNFSDWVIEDNIDRFCQCIEKQEHDFVCLNDGDIEVDFNMLSDRLAASFEKILPDKSEFEL